MIRTLLLSVSVLALAACGGDVHSEEDARLAYVGLDQSIERALNLGMAGYNAASSANIPAQSGQGSVSGTMTITGQVDQGSSSNKGMRLFVGLTDYADTVTLEEFKGREVTYDTATDVTAQPALTLSLRNIPNGTFTGTLVGTFQMAGDLEGEVTLNLTFDGQIRAVAGSTEDIERVPGTTHITGTAVSKAGTFNVDVTR